MPTTVGCPSGGCSSPAARASSSLSMAGSSSVTSPEASCCSSACARCSSSGSAATGAGPNLEGVFETPPPHASALRDRRSEREGAAGGARESWGRTCSGGWNIAGTGPCGTSCGRRTARAAS